MLRPFWPRSALRLAPSKPVPIGTKGRPQGRPFCVTPRVARKEGWPCPQGTPPHPADPSHRGAGLLQPTSRPETPRYRHRHRRQRPAPRSRNRHGSGQGQRRPDWQDPPPATAQTHPAVPRPRQHSIRRFQPGRPGQNTAGTAGPAPSTRDRGARNPRHRTQRSRHAPRGISRRTGPALRPPSFITSD